MHGRTMSSSQLADPLLKELEGLSWGGIGTSTAADYFPTADVEKLVNHCKAFCDQGEQPGSIPRRAVACVELASDFQQRLRGTGSDPPVVNLFRS